MPNESRLPASVGSGWDADAKAWRGFIRLPGQEIIFTDPHPDRDAAESEAMDVVMEVMEMVGGRVAAVGPVRHYDENSTTNDLPPLRMPYEDN